jgi:hypothetical protein
MAITMTVLRDGYWDGQYAHPGDTITVDDPWVETLEVAGFAVRYEQELSWPATPSTSLPGRFTPKTASPTPKARRTP